MAAKKKATSKMPPGIPEYAVKQETLMRFFRPTIGKSTFYKLVNEGVIVKMKEVDGCYLLNESLIRLGLQPLSELPADPNAAQRDRQLLELALSLVAPDVVPPPSWMLSDDRLTDQEESYVALLAMHHHREMAEFTLQPARLAYVGGVFDAAEMLRNPPPPKSGPGMWVCGWCVSIEVKAPRHGPSVRWQDAGPPLIYDTRSARVAVGAPPNS